MSDGEPVGLSDLLTGLADATKTELATMPEVQEAGSTIDVASLPAVARRWIKIKDVVAVVADLKNSTKSGTGKKAASTASIYQAATGGVVEIYDTFDADFIQIQGDGAFALFWGDRRYERAACAGITVKTFSLDLAAQIEKKWETTPETGFKVGVASSRILVKRIGTPRNPAQQEPVWAGKAVNYAAKAAQGADRHHMVITGTVWDQFEKNEYLAFSCPCGSGPAWASGRTRRSIVSRTMTRTPKAEFSSLDGAIPTDPTTATPSWREPRSATTSTISVPRSSRHRWRRRSDAPRTSTASSAKSTDWA